MEKKFAGKVQTVLGFIDGVELGLTLPHEHLLLDLTVRFKLMNESVTAKTMAEKPLTLDMAGWIRFHLFENRDNLLLNDEELAIKEIMRFKLAGGRSVVDVTNWGSRQDPHAMARLARTTGHNIIMGTGYYTMDSGCAEVLARKTEDEICRDIVNDITVGTDGICAGIIGEIGADSWPLQRARTSLTITGCPSTSFPSDSRTSASKPSTSILTRVREENSRSGTRSCKRVVIIGTAMRSAAPA